MEILLSHRKEGREDGFAMIEVMIAIVILAVGLLGLAALMASLTGTTTQSRYLGTEVMLASEKLEDLNQLPNLDPRVAVGGGLNPAAPTASYNDIVQVSSANGTVLDYTGQVAPASPNTKDLISFQRLWVIETGVGGLGNAKRITVLIVPLTGTAAERTATFQTTAVRTSTVGQ